MYVSEWPWLTEVGNFLGLLWRFQVLDHPLVMLGDLAYDSGSMATKIAAIVWCATTVVFLLLERFSLSACIQFNFWNFSLSSRICRGRDDDGGGLLFKQQDIDKIVAVADPHGPGAVMWPMTAQTGRVILDLSVSETNKALLLQAKGIIPLLVSSLLLDPGAETGRPTLSRFYIKVGDHLPFYQDRLVTNVAKVKGNEDFGRRSAQREAEFRCDRTGGATVRKTASFLCFPYVCPEPVLAK